MVNYNPPKPPKGKGRPPGSPNQSTAMARDAIARLVDGNAERLAGWLEDIAVEHGALKAWDCMMDVLEYHIPKLARTEMTGKDGGSIQVSWPLAKSKLDE